MINRLSPNKSKSEKESPSITEQGMDVHIVDFRDALKPGVDYFNSGLVALPDRDWLVVRRSTHNPKMQFGFNDIVAFGLDDFVPQVGIPLKPHLIGGSQEHFEDPRCVYHDGYIWIGACNFIWYGEKGMWTGAHQVLLKFKTDWTCVKRYDPVYGNNLDRISAKKGMEKNWLWFWNRDCLHLVYKACPHVVAVFDKDLNLLTEYSSDWKSNWKYGEIRGGTPPVLADDGLYWSFYHSSVPWRGGKRCYYMGAYAFEPIEPFNVVYITPKPLLVGSQYDRWHVSKPKCVFPCGTILRDTEWTISLGINDFDTAIMRLTHKKLISLVLPV